MASYPSSRSEWAALDWQEAQHEVAKLLNRHGFMIFEEKKFENHKRSDVVVIKQDENRVVFGIIEVKCYQKVTRSLQKNAMLQGLKYFKSLYKTTFKNKRWGNKIKHYFIAVVYTNDYPAAFYHQSLDKYRHKIPQQLIQQDAITLFSSTPNTLISKMQYIVPNLYTQTKIDDFEFVDL